MLNAFPSPAKKVLPLLLSLLLGAVTLHAAVVGDFNGDGRADVLWRNLQTGENAVWLMNGGTIVTGAFLPTISDPNWQMVGVGDFDGNGTADVLWRNVNTGQNAIWFMAGGAVSSGAFLPAISDLNWHIAGIGDLNGDGKADIVWRNALTGANALWLMNGAAIAAGQYLPSVSDLNFQIVAVADFDGDGKADILWRNAATGQNAVWFMNGGNISSGQFLPTISDTHLAIVGAADFNGDGKADVLWHNVATGQNAVWLMNGALIQSGQFLPTVGDTNLQIVGIADFNGDGKADILWRNVQTGENAVWLMNGATVQSGQFLATVTDRNWNVRLIPGRFAPASVTAAPVIQPSAFVLSVLGISASTQSGAIVAVDPQGLPITYDILQAPGVGTLALDYSTGAFTYTVPGHTSATADSFVISVANGSASATSTVHVQLAIDPLLPNQWHIQNTGQNAFSSIFPTAGNDMDVAGAWAAGFTGKGIKVGVVDTGLEAAHEDLAANVDLTHSWNFLTGTNDPTRDPADVNPPEDHGTQVAGIIGAVAFNGKGGRGVAFNSTLRGYNLIAPGLPFSVTNMAVAMGSDPISSDNDEFNASFGDGFCALPQFSSAYQSITANTLTLRTGLGAAIVNAAGNNFGDWQSLESSSTCHSLCQYANQYGVSCGDPATDERRGGYVPLIVGALNANGTHASYSSTGSSLWISAPGGENGFNSTYVSDADPNGFKPAIITTSRTGCVYAENSAAQFPKGVNPLDANGSNPNSQNCQYTALMNGTSAATPNTAGVVALMLEANPKLSVRDIKYILAKTAKKVDSTFAGVSRTDIVSGSTVVLEQGWVTNAVGWSFSNRYGFGGVDAEAAVAMAKSYTAYLPAVQTSQEYTFLAAPPATIPAYSAIGAYVTFNVAESFSTVEQVIVFLNIDYLRTDYTPSLACNQVELTSPSGTKSILLHAANGFNNGYVTDSRILSNAFYGEPVNGTWKLRFFDFCSASSTATQLSTVNPQELIIVGH